MTLAFSFVSLLALSCAPASISNTELPGGSCCVCNRASDEAVSLFYFFPCEGIYNVGCKLAKVWLSYSHSREIFEQVARALFRIPRGT